MLILKVHKNRWFSEEFGGIGNGGQRPACSGLQLNLDGGGMAVFQGPASTSIGTHTRRYDLGNTQWIEHGLFLLIDLVQGYGIIGGVVHMALDLQQHVVHLVLPFLIAGQIDLLGLFKLLALFLKNCRIHGKYVRQAQEKQLIGHGG